MCSGGEPGHREQRLPPRCEPRRCAAREVELEERRRDFGVRCVSLVAAQRLDLLAAPAGHEQAGEHLRGDISSRARSRRASVGRIGDVVARRVAAEETILCTRSGASVASRAVASPAHEQADSVAAPSVHASDRRELRGLGLGVGGRSSARWEVRPEPVVADDPMRPGEALVERPGIGVVHSSSRCDTQRPPNSRSGPAPTPAYAIRRPSSSRSGRPAPSPAIVLARTGQRREDGLPWKYRARRSLTMPICTHGTSTGSRSGSCATAAPTRSRCLRAPRLALTRAALLRRQAAARRRGAGRASASTPITTSSPTSRRALAPPGWRGWCATAGRRRSHSRWPTSTRAGRRIGART